MSEKAPVPDFTGFWEPWQKALAEKHGLTCPPGWYGFACGEGWMALLDKAFGDLKAAGWSGEIHQVKEKFGTLRMYVGEDGDPSLRIIIHEAEEASARTCEHCGAEGETCMKGWWVHTLCPGCDEKHHVKRESK